MSDLEKSMLFQDLPQEWQSRLSGNGKLEALSWVVGLNAVVEKQYQGDWSFMLDRLRKLGRFEQAAAIEAIAPGSIAYYLLFRALVEKYDRSLMEAKEYVQVNNLEGILQIAFLLSDTQLQRLVENFIALKIESGNRADAHLHKSNK